MLQPFEQTLLRSVLDEPELYGDPEEFKTYTRPHMSNFMVPYYLKKRLEEEGIINYERLL